MALSLSTVTLVAATRNSFANNLLSLIDAGTAAILELYTSATPGSGTLLATLTYPATSFSVSGAVLTALGVPLTNNAVASGVPQSYQLKTQAAGSVIVEGAVSGGDTINSGQPVNLTSMTITIGA